MAEARPVTVDAFFEGAPVARLVFDRLRTVVEGLGPCTVRVTRSQVAFRRRRGFAYLWIPGRYLSRTQAPVVVSIALDHELHSPRFKEVVEPSPGHWMHHLEVHDPEDLDDEVVGWLAQAAAQADGS